MFEDAYSELFNGIGYVFAIISLGVIFAIITNVIFGIITNAVSDAIQKAITKHKSKKAEKEIPTWGDFFVENNQRLWSIIESDIDNIKFDFWSSVKGDAVFAYKYGRYRIYLWTGKEEDCSLHTLREDGKESIVLCGKYSDSLAKKLISRFVDDFGRMPNAKEIDDAYGVKRHSLCK